MLSLLCTRHHSCTTTRQKITGDSTYYGEPLLALQGDGAAESAEGQSYGGVMVEGCRAEYASCGDWTKYYDAEYACDYYHNYRRVWRKINDLCCAADHAAFFCVFV